MTWLYSKKKALLYGFPTSAPYQKWGRKTPKFRKGSAAMLLNHYISAAVRAISTKFGILMHFDILDLFDRKKFEI